MAGKTNKGFAAAVAEGEVKGAGRALLEDLFEDYYKHRKRLYFMNLVRGLFFGFGSVVGGTIMVALLFWILSLLNFIPFLNDIIDAARHTVESRPR
jgi:hypothetical protein